MLLEIAFPLQAYKLRPKGREVLVHNESTLQGIPALPVSRGGGGSGKHPIIAQIKDED